MTVTTPRRLLSDQVAVETFAGGLSFGLIMATWMSEDKKDRGSRQRTVLRDSRVLPRPGGMRNTETQGVLRQRHRLTAGLGSLGLP